MWSYRSRLTRDVQRWRSEGWISAEAEGNILRDAARQRGFNLPTVLGILAAVLFSFAAMSFVAAHWDEMPRLARTGLLLGLIVAGYGAAGAFATRGAHVFSDAAILFSSAMFGASIMLISQMFHIEGHPPDGILLWMLGALLAGAVLRSNPALALAMVLACIWAAMETADRNALYWPFLIAWAVITAAFYWQGWRPGFDISALALSLFIISYGYWHDRVTAHQAVVATGLAAMLAAAGTEYVRRELEPFAGRAMAYALAVAYAGLFALQFMTYNRGDARFLALAALSLAVLIGATIYGLRTDKKTLAWVGYVGFSIEIFGIYVKTIGTLLGTSLFFMVAGLIIAALAAVAWRLAKRDAAGSSAA